MPSHIDNPPFVIMESLAGSAETPASVWRSGTLSAGPLVTDQVTDAPQPWTHVIRPQRPWLDLKLRELWQSRDLIALFVWRDFVAIYKQTVLGPLWYLIQPVLTTVMFTVVFGRIAGLPADGVPHFVFYMAGTVIWTFFSTCVTKTSNTFVMNAGLFGKVYFPRMAVPIAVVISTLVTLGVQMLLFASVIGYFLVSGGTALRPNAWMLLTPALVLIMAALGMGTGVLVSAVTTRYRDLQQLMAFGIQLLMYATPVIYPVSAVGPGYRSVLLANPLSPVVEAFRYAYLGGGTLSGGGLCYSAACAAGVLVLGAVVFNRVERTFMDSV